MSTLQALFSQFQHGNESAIPPDVLRSAMATCYEEQHRFQLGLMDDAAECFVRELCNCAVLSVIVAPVSTGEDPGAGALPSHW